MNVILWEHVISWVFITYFTLTAAKTSLYRVNPQPQFSSLLSSILPHKFMPLPKPQYYSGSWYRLLNCCKTFWQGWVGECSVTVMIVCVFYCGSIKKQTNKQTEGWRQENICGVFSSWTIFQSKIPQRTGSNLRIN